MELKGKQVLVVGGAKTGVSTARFLLSRGAGVMISEKNPVLDLPGDISSAVKGIETGRHSPETFLNQDLIVVSPGVPLSIGALQNAGEKGVEIISEIELAFQFLKTPLIAVTGTNGKTTTATLLNRIFTQCGRKVFTGGNIGTPLIDYVTGEQTADFVIAEVSSFQLEAIRSFRPRISVLLNITEDHLDRYASFADYVKAKSAIFKNQTGADTAILNYDDPNTRTVDQGIRAKKIFFSTATALSEGVYYNDLVRFCAAGRKIMMPTDGFRLSGVHNRENIMAAAAVSFLCGLDPERVRSAIASFKGMPHRMEFVAEKEGRCFYNDSKATNVGACVKSVESLPPPIILIAGGRDKQGSYDPLKPLLKNRVKLLLLIGEASDRMASALGGTVKTIQEKNLETAIYTAAKHAAAGDTILFSPACSSFDMFKSYEHRGDCFKQTVMTLLTSRGMS